MNFADAQTYLTSQAFNSIVLILCFLAVRWSLILGVRRWKAPSPDEKRRWIVHVKNFSLIILFMLCFINLIEDYVKVVFNSETEFLFF